MSPRPNAPRRLLARPRPRPDADPAGLDLVPSHEHHDRASVGPRSAEAPIGGGGRSGSARLARRLRSDRGDIPGWVLVTVMTAGLVTAVWLIADGQLTSILNRALVSVSSV